MTGAAYWRELIERHVRGRKVVLATGMLATAKPFVDLMRELGAEKPLILAEDVGTGDLPAAEEAEWHLVGRRGPTLMDNIRGYDAGLRDLAPPVAAALERYDPERTALVIRSFTVGARHIGGRPVWGARQEEWVALEDKTVIDAFWDELGIPRAPATVVAARGAALADAAAELDRGRGTVWAGDAREGWHGAATYTRWVRGEPESAVVEFFAEHCDRLRVMPFLEGIPCSIHGIVLPDYVIALRPVEMVVMRRADSAEFFYAGCATFWDPAPGDREAMRAMTTVVGAALRDKVGFRGTFTIDGVMTEDGFLPTELNPRFGAGILTVARTLPELPLQLIDEAICAGEPWDFRAPELEGLLLRHADTSRAGGGTAVSKTARSETETLRLVEEAGRYRFAEEGEAADGTLMIGPSPIGSFMRFQLDPERNAPGDSVAPRARMAFELADRELGTGIGALEVAEVKR